MKKLVYNLFLVFAILFSVVSNAQHVNLGPNDIVKGKLRLKLKNEYLQDVNTLSGVGKKNTNVLGIERLDDLNSKNSIKRMVRVFPFSIKNEAKHREYGLHLWYEIDFDAEKDPFRLAEEYSLLDEVEIAKPLYKKIFVDGYQQDSVVVYLDTIRTTGRKVSYGKRSDTFSVENVMNDFNDPLLDQQWHYQNDGTIGDKGVDIDLFNAWTKSTGDSKVIVSVVDGGIDANHEDLRDNMWVNEAELNGEVGVDDDGNGYVDDVNGYNFVYNGALTSHDHGTHVAGTISAVNNNGIGVAGVAGGDGSGNGVRLMSCQIYDNRGGSGNSAAAIVYGADNGAIISQNSWGYTQPGFYEPEVYDAIKYFIAEAGNYEGSPMKGGVVICAAGNTGRNEEHYPAAFEEVIAVGASGPTGYPAPYSTMGTWVDITAPGGDQAYYGYEGGILSTLPGSEYGFFQGTSMACPHASGVAALVASRFGGDGFIASEMRKIMINSTTPFIYDSKGVMGSGDLNAAIALIENEFKAPDAITDLHSEEVFHNEVRLQWTVPVDDDDFQPSVFYFAFSEEEITATNFNQQKIYQIPTNYEAGSKVNINITGLIKKTDYWFAVKSGDRHQNISDISNILKVTTTDAPNFQESLRNVEFQIDITENPVRRVPITFSNTGEGIVYWISSNVNETSFWTQWEEWLSDKDELLGTNTAKKETELGKKLAQTKEPVQLTAELLQGKDMDYWTENDNTEFRDYYTYVSSTPAYALGSSSENFGLTYAARFEAERYEFNMTHIALGLFTFTKEPIYIELRRGDKDLESSEIFYVQKYIPPGEGGLSSESIPLVKPQHIKKGEKIWVVLYFSRKEPYPLLAHSRGYYKDTFYASVNNGQTFKEAWKLLPAKAVPFITLLSTGEDAPYVFIDPLRGEIHQGETQELEMIIDASKLSNGKHVATMGIRTTDINKPGIGIKVKVEVSGQGAKARVKELYNYEVQTNKDNNLNIEIKNIGLDSLFVTDVVRADNGKSLKAFEDSVRIGVNRTVDVPFVYNPATAGTEKPKLLLKTSIGDVSVSTKFDASVPAIIDASVNSPTVDVQYGDTEKMKLTIKNDGTGSILNYSLENYNPAFLSNGLNPTKFDYIIRTSSDLDNPVTDTTVVDISSVATTHYDLMPRWYTKMDVENSFPMYDYTLGSLYVLNTGNFYGYRAGRFDYEEGVGEKNRGSALIGALYIKKNCTISNFDFISLGDRYIYDITLSLKKYEVTGVEVVGTMRYQVVLYRNGKIVIHYIDVDLLHELHIEEYSIGIQGAAAGDDLIYRKYNETDKPIHSGMTIMFEPTNDPTFISVDDSRKGSIAKGEEIEIDLTVNPKYANVLGGTYHNLLKLESDASVETDIIPITVNVLGKAEFDAPDSLVFKETHVGFSNEKYLIVDNKGGVRGEITNITFDNAEYHTSQTTPLIIEPNAKVLVPITYEPKSLASHLSSVTLDYSDGTSETVILDSDVKANPEFTISIKDVDVEVDGGKAVKVPFTITTKNTGTNLVYKFKNNLFAKVSNGKGQGVNPDTTQLYGYSRMVGDSTRAIYKWKNVKENGTPHAIDLEKQKAIKLPFKFPFYGAEYDSIWISRNGYISVVKPTADIFVGEFVKGDGMSGVIAPFIADLIPSDSDSKVWTLVEEDRVYVFWDRYRGSDVSSAGGSITFQVEIVNDGSIFFHYGSISNYTHMLNYGLESPDERETFEDYKTWILKWGVLKDSITLAITPPVYGRLLSSEQGKFDLNVSAEYIYKSGIYKDTIVLSTNDNAQPELFIPVKLKVNGASNIELVDSLNYGEIIFASDKRVKKTFTLTNTGHDVLEINKVKSTDLPDFKLYNEKGDLIKRTSNGSLFSSISVKPWESVTLQSEIALLSNDDVDGSLTLSGNFDDYQIEVLADIVESPEFVWDATDQQFSLNNTEKPEFSITIQNNGPTAMKYDMFPAVVPVIEEGGSTPDPIVEELGEYFFEEPVTVDSLYLETKKNADGYEMPKVPTKLCFSNAYIAPEGGFYLTHVKLNANFRGLREYIKIQVYKGGDKPQEGELMYEQKFPIHIFVNDEWIYFPLKFPLTFAEGEKFFIVVQPPFASKYIGYDIATDEDELENVWVSNWQAWEGGGWNWQQYKNMMRKYKIRAVTAAGEGLWVVLDNTNGVVESGQSKVIKATVDPVLSGGGKHKAFIKVATNDVNHRRDEVKIDLTVNNAPVIDFRPNMYKKVIKVKETEELSVNYLFNDIDDETMSMSLGEVNDTISMLPILKQTSNNTGNITFKPSYDDSGFYKFPINIADEAGNVVTDQIMIEVKDKNRAPVMDAKFDVVTLNMADSDGGVLVIDPDELFDDPDGDDLRILAGNYTPDIVDMAIGQNYIDLHALKTGTGFVVFGADDGKENGFVVYGVYVIVIDDESTSDSNPDGFNEEAEMLVGDGSKFAVYPNPISSGQANAIFKLDQAGEVTIDVLSVDGILLKSINKGYMNEGIFTESMDVNSVSNGVYILNLKVNGQVLETLKVLVK
jgi:subtilisin family serine protease